MQIKQFCWKKLTKPLFDHFENYFRSQLWNAFRTIYVAFFTFFSGLTSEVQSQYKKSAQVGASRRKSAIFSASRLLR